MKTTISNPTKIGIITIITLALTYWGFNFLKGKDIFNKENTFYVLYDKIEGLEPSNPVYIRGFKIGQVRDIKFTDATHATFTVTLKLKSDVNISDSTIARIFSNDLMGNKAIEIVLGKSPIYLKDGDTLIPQIEESLSEQVRLQVLPLKNEAQKLLVDLQQAAQSVSYVLNENTGKKLADSFSKIQDAISSIYRAANSLDTILTGNKADIGNILSNFKSISNNLKNNNNNISNILANFESISDSLAKSNLKHTLITLDSVMTDFNVVLSKIQKGEGSLGMLINDDSLYINLENASKDLDILLKDIEDNPKRYVHFSVFGKSGDKKDKKK